MNRKEAFRSIVGSCNYNLNDKSSDKDYKVFIYPTFDDIYTNKKINSHRNVDGNDVDYYDIRELPRLLLKSNINFLETLFSVEVALFDNPGKDKLSGLFLEREAIASMNLPYLYAACMGMHHNKLKDINKINVSISSKDNSIYNTKAAMTTYRVLDFLRRYADNNFTSFAQAIKYNDRERDSLLSIKKGKYNIREVEEMINNLKEEVENKYKEAYMAKKLNEDTLIFMERIVKEAVKENINI